MTELTLESLAKRLEALEKKVNEQTTAQAIPPISSKDWRRSIGFEQIPGLRFENWID